MELSPQTKPLRGAQLVDAADICCPPAWRSPVRQRGVFCPSTWIMTCPLSLAASGFRTFRLPVGGLVEAPALLSLDDLRSLGVKTQVTKHNCIQGWTATGQWAGVPLCRLLDLVRPTDEAGTVVFYAFDDKGETEGEGRWGYFYSTVPLWLARKPQTILVLEMNGGPLPRRARCTAPGSYRNPARLQDDQVGQGDRAHPRLSRHRDGPGGWREDQQYYANAAGI